MAIGTPFGLARTLTLGVVSNNDRTFYPDRMDINGYETGDFAKRVNPQMVGVEKLEDAKEIAAVRAMIQKHLDYTKSDRAKTILASWDQFVPKFVKVMPKDYKRVLQSLKKVQSQGLSGEQAIMAAFEENARDVSRVGGS